MDQYSTVVNHLMDIPILANAVAKMGECADTIDLIKTDWDKHLDNYVVYQDFVDNKNMFKESTKAPNPNFRVETIRDPQQQPLKVLLVATSCYIGRPFQADQNPTKKTEGFNITVRDSVVIDKLCRGLTNELDESIQRANLTKLYMPLCNILSCAGCFKSREQYLAAGYQIPLENQPCIAKTKVYDGQRVVNRFSSQLKDLFRGEFMAIVQIQINSRIFYDKTEIDGSVSKIVKMGGNVLNMIAFHASKLMASTEDIFLGELTQSTHEPSEDKPFVIPADEEEVESACQVEWTCKRSLEDEVDENDVIEAMPLQMHDGGSSAQRGIKRNRTDVNFSEERTFII